MSGECIRRCRNRAAGSGRLTRRALRAPEGLNLDDRDRPDLKRRLNGVVRRPVVKIGLSVAATSDRQRNTPTALLRPLARSYTRPLLMCALPPCAQTVVATATEKEHEQENYQNC